MGCGALAAPNQCHSFIDLMEKTGADFTVLIGGTLCCGNNNTFAGDLKGADAIARDLIKNINFFSPDKLVVTCPRCFVKIEGFFPKFLSYDFEVQFFTNFLLENIHKFEFTQSLEKKVTLNDPCRLARGEFQDHLSARKLLKAIPGVKLVEMNSTKQESPCCGGMAGLINPEYRFQFSEPLLKEAGNSGADLMMNICYGCHTTLCRYEEQYPYDFMDMPSFLNEATGGKIYEDKFKKYWKYCDNEKILDESRECFEAYGFSMDEMKSIIPLIFSK
jgi:heterodisulfide reductase subunit D